MRAVGAGMTSFRRWIGTGLASAAVAMVAVSGMSHAPSPKTASPSPHAAKPVPPAPLYIGNRIAELGQGFNGQVGISVKSIDEGWSAGWKADELYPQQSVSK